MKKKKSHDGSGNAFMDLERASTGLVEAILGLMGAERAKVKGRQPVAKKGRRRKA